MLNLILKDYQISRKGMALNFIVIPLVFLTLIALKDFNLFMIFFFMYFFAMNYVSTLFSTEEKNHSEIFILSMPVTRRTVVTARYASVIGVTMICGLVAGLMASVSHQVMLNATISFGEVFYYGSLAVLINTVSMSVLIPLMYRFGYTKASEYNRLMVMLVVFVPVTFKMLSIKLAADSRLLLFINTLGSRLESWSPIHLGLTGLIVSAMIWVISYATSNKAYAQ